MFQVQTHRLKAEKRYGEYEECPVDLPLIKGQGMSLTVDWSAFINRVSLDFRQKSS